MHRWFEAARPLLFQGLTYAPFQPKLWKGRIPSPAQANDPPQTLTVSHLIEKIPSSDPRYPAQLLKRLGNHAPTELTALGNLAHLKTHKTALFCSARCPGDRILRIHEHVQSLRDQSVTVISGFHSPVEKDCLRILLRGHQPIIICPARSLIGMVIPAAWQSALNSGRLLMLSIFPSTQRRASVTTAKRRNKFVAALADNLFVAHAGPGGLIEALGEQRPCLIRASDGSFDRD